LRERLVQAAQTTAAKIKASPGGRSLLLWIKKILATRLDLSVIPAKVGVSKLDTRKKRGNKMDIENLDAKDVAIMTMGAIGATVEMYVEQGYADPALYKLVEFIEGLSVNLEFPELTERLTVLKLQTGEAVNEYIDTHGLSVKKDEWSK
jgi:hypothetical protein